jgi:hypothetical protein
MRHIKQLLVLFLVFNVFASCEKEEVSYALQDISAPTDVQAIFDISQDEVGLVTLTPAATGASEFLVYFGDEENETPTKVNPGETINYTYAEGEYSLRIIAVGLTGLTSELVRIVTVSFDAPKDLIANIGISDTNPFEVTVTPSATNATVFDVYFGDVEDEEATTIMASETASHVYAEIGDYTIRVVARGAGAATLEMTEEVSITGAVKAVTLPITFDDATVNYTINGFGASDGSSIPVAVIENPDASGINTTAKVLSVNKLVDAQVWAGASIPLEGPIDFTNGSTISLKVWSPRAGTPILLKLEDSSSPKDDNGNPTVFIEVQVNSTLANTWEELTFDLSSNADFSTSKSYDTVIVFPDFGTVGKGEFFYFDDIKLAAGDGGGDGSGLISDDFDANRNIDTWAGDACGMNDAFPNPFKTGINTSNTVLEYNDDGGQYANVRFDVVPNFDLSVDNTFSLKIYVPSSGITGSQPNQISLKLQDGTAGEPWAQQTEIVKPIELDKWQTVTFNFATDVTAGAADPLSRTDFNRVVLQVNGEGNSDKVIAYIDDFLYGTPDGGTTGGTSEPTAAAPTPTQDAANVKSVFSDSYTDIAGTNLDANWQGDIVSETVAIAGNDAVKYSNVKYIGMQLAADTDFSDMEFLHIDIWTPDATVLEITPIGGTENLVGLSGLTQGEWKSYDIPVSDFTGVDFSKILQFKIDAQTGVNPAVVYMDNLYFYKTGGGGGGTTCTDTTLVLPIDFDCDGIDYASKANRSTATFSVVDNPYKTGANTADSKVGKFINDNAEGWENILFELDTPVDFATDRTIKLKLYSTVAATIKLKFEAPGATEVDANHGGTGWEELSFTLPSTDSFSDMVLFVDGPDATAGTFYIDDIELVATTGGGATGDLAMNGDFETGNLNDWAVYENGGIVIADNAQSNGGDWSAKIVASPTGLNPTLKQERKGAGSIVIGDVVQITFDYMGSAAAGGIYSIQSFVEATNGVNQTEIFSVTPTATWQTFTTTYTVNAGDVSGGITMEFTAICGGVAGCSSTLYLDNVSVILNP